MDLLAFAIAPLSAKVQLWKRQSGRKRGLGSFAFKNADDKSVPEIEMGVCAEEPAPELEPASGAPPMTPPPNPGGSGIVGGGGSIGQPLAPSGRPVLILPAEACGSATRGEPPGTPPGAPAACGIGRTTTGGRVARIEQRIA